MLLLGGAGNPTRPYGKPIDSLLDYRYEFQLQCAAKATQEFSDVIQLFHYKSQILYPHVFHVSIVYQVLL